MALSRKTASNASLLVFMLSLNDLYVDWSTTLPMKKLLPSLTLSAFSLTGCATIDAVGNIEEPKYNVIKQEGDFELRQVAAQRVAVNRFSGFSGEQKVADKTAQLNDWMKRSNLSPSGAPQLARYNMPLTPPPFRRNEILIAVK